MELEDIKPEEYYSLVFNKFEISTFKCKSIDKLTIYYYYEIFPFHNVFRNKNNWDFEERIREATEEEIIWYEYCKSHEQYRSKEEALENYYLKEFIEQYLTEE